ncbi:MAG TPA: hypothetical protein VJU77_09960 [Chthoniobacterales bacterium]|nr:hypothetical protein [Chthoniobacterales bacterium]
MAKKKDQSLTERISALINRVGELPTPSMADIKGELVPCLGLTQTLEDGTVVRDLEAQIEAQKAALEKLEEEKRNLKTELQPLRTEVEAFRAEREKQQEAEREIDPIQLKILRKLPSEYSGQAMDIHEIGRSVSVPVDEAELYTQSLEAQGFVNRFHNRMEGTTWRRSPKGNQLVVSKRWAGEEEPKEIKPQRSQHGELTSSEETILLLLARNESEGASPDEVAESLHGTAPMALFLLVRLRQRNMASDKAAPNFNTPRQWFILRAGLEHLSERGLI